LELAYFIPTLNTSALIINNENTFDYSIMT